MGFEFLDLGFGIVLGLGRGRSLTHFAHAQVLLVLALFPLALEHLVGFGTQLLGGGTVADGIHNGQFIHQRGGQTGIYWPIFRYDT